MIDAQTWLVAVAACVVIAAVWAWGIVREDAAVVRAHASGIAAGRALERSAARGAIVADTTTPAANASARARTAPISPDSAFSGQIIDPAPSTLSAGGVAGQPDAPVRREIPAWLRGPGGSRERIG